MTTNLVPYDENKSIEVQFAQALEHYQLHKSDASVSPFDFLQTFKQIAASQALKLGSELNDDESNAHLYEQFSSWDLETKLWNLAEDLYSSRLSSPEDFHVHDYSSLSLKQDQFLSSHPKLKELLIIINWIQRNTNSFSYQSNEQTKWQNTKIALQTADVSVFIQDNTKSNQKFIDKLDIDAPLRSNLPVHPNDQLIDSENYSVIYKLILSGKIQEAIDYANTTGNFALALILVGAAQDSGDDNDSQAGGLKHKLLWKETVYKLSQQSNLNKYEKLIYNYLCGGDISENLKAAGNSWEESLLLYAYQLLSYKLDLFILENSSESLSISIPKPHPRSINEILNALSSANTEVAAESLNPLRIISGAIMIDEVWSVIQKIDNDSLENKNILRILVHLAIFIALVRPIEDASALTSIIRFYISDLLETNMSDLIPVYLSFIPNETDARETYSIILSSITDKDERTRQLKAAKKISQPFINEEVGDMIIVDDDDKLVNVLRRTVERVMKETEPYYQNESAVLVHDDDSKTDETDFTLYRAVEWFFENHMYEDAIKATIVVVRRFLANGKLASLKRFASGNDFKRLILDYNVSVIHKKDDNEISEDVKQELLEYNNFIEALTLIDDWKSFTASGNSYNGSTVESSLEKTNKVLKSILSKWLLDLPDPVFKDFRALYIPYLIMELITIYQNARVKDWKYIHQAYGLINEVADNSENDYLECFTKSGRLNEFLVKCGELSIVSSERGIQGIFSPVK
ncbi:NUP84 Nucleoporin NUP84 [Candida maltosa Xu316]